MVNMWYLTTWPPFGQVPLFEMNALDSSTNTPISVHTAGHKCVFCIFILTYIFLGCHHFHATKSISMPLDAKKASPIQEDNGVGLGGSIERLFSFNEPPNALNLESGVISFSCHFLVSDGERTLECFCGRFLAFGFACVGGNATSAGGRQVTGGRDVHAMYFVRLANPY